MFSYFQVIHEPWIQINDDEIIELRDPKNNSGHNTLSERAFDQQHY